MLYSTWQIVVKKKMQKPVKIFCGRSEIALYHLRGGSGVAAPSERRFSDRAPEWEPWEYDQISVFNAPNAKNCSASARGRKPYAL